MLILSFFSILIFSALPTFETFKENDNAMFEWFDLLLDLRNSIFARFPELQISPNELDVGPILAGVIENMNTTGTVSQILNRTFNNIFGTNFAITPREFHKFENSTGEIAIQESIFPPLAHFFVWEPITGYTLSEEEWTEIIQEWNGLISSSSILILIFGIGFLLFFFQILFCKCCCKPIKYVPRAGGCLMFFAILTLLFSIISFVFFVIGCIKLTVFRKKLYDLPNYLPEITTPLTDSLEKMALNFSVFVNDTFDVALDNLDELTSSITTQTETMTTSISELQQKVDGSELQTAIDKLNTDMSNLKSKLSASTDETIKQYAEQLPDPFQIENVRSIMKQPFSYMLNYADDTKGAIRFGDSIKEFINSVNKFTKLSTISFGQHTAEYYVDLSETDKYEDTGAINTIFSKEVFGVLSIMFDNYVVLQVIVICIAVLMILLLFLFFLSMICNNKCTRCFAHTSSVLPFIISVIIFFIGLIITFVGATLSSLTHTFNSAISQTFNEALDVFGLTKIQMQPIDLSTITNGYLSNTLVFSDILVNAFQPQDTNNLIKSEYGTGLYTALNLSSKLQPSDIPNSIASTLYTFAESPEISQEITDNLNLANTLFTPLVTSDFQFLFSPNMNNFISQLEMLAQNDQDLSSAIQTFKNSFQNNPFSEDYSTLSACYNLILSDVSDIITEGGTDAATTFKYLLQGIFNALDLFDIKPIAGLLIFIWNDFILNFGEALAYVSIGAHLYMIGSILMVIALMRRRKYMLSQEQVILNQQNKKLKRKYRHHFDLVDDQDNLLLDFQPRYETAKSNVSSSGGGFEGLWRANDNSSSDTPDLLA